MTREEAEEFVCMAVALAMSRDGSSGGVIRLVTINKEGTTKRMVRPEEQPVFWDELPPPAGMLV